MLEWIQTSGAKILAVILAIWLVNKFGSFLIHHFTFRALSHDKYASEEDEERRAKTLSALIYNIFKILTWGIATLVIAKGFGLNVGPLLAGAGVAGLAIAFGAQELIKDFISGVFIVLENQYRVGDIVELNGLSGSVKAITMRTTILRDLNGKVYHIRNGQINSSINMTMEFSQVNMDIGVSYESDLDKVEKVINQVGAKLFNEKDWKDKIIEAIRFVRVKSLGESAIIVKVVGKTKAGAHWAVGGEFLKRLKKAFDKEDIVIPYPQRVIHKAKD